MVKHIILWKLKDSLSEEEKKAVKEGAKAGLESLQGRIPGLLKITVRIEGLKSSNADMMLDCDFEDEDSLKFYASHPEHNSVANAKVRPYTQTRLCLDYKEK